MTSLLRQVGELSPSPDTMKKMTRTINEHWKPVYLNCGPCSEKYDVVIKMETFARDSLYLKQKLGLDIDVDFVRKGGREGHTTLDRWKAPASTTSPAYTSIASNVTASFPFPTSHISSYPVPSLLTNIGSLESFFLAPAEG